MKYYEIYSGLAFRHCMFWSVCNFLSVSELQKKIKEKTQYLMNTLYVMSIHHHKLNRLKVMGTILHV